MGGVAEMINQSRRSFITGLVSLVAAPAIVRVSSIMPVKQMLPAPEDIYAEIARFLLQQTEALRQRIAAAEGVLLEGVKTEIVDDRVFGISGRSNFIYASDPVPRR